MIKLILQRIFLRKRRSFENRENRENQNEIK